MESLDENNVGWLLILYFLFNDIVQLLIGTTTDAEAKKLFLNLRETEFVCFGLELLYVVNLF